MLSKQARAADCSAAQVLHVATKRGASGRVHGDVQVTLNPEHTGGTAVRVVIESKTGRLSSSAEAGT